jgi:hypothetical protein
MSCHITLRWSLSVSGTGVCIPTRPRADRMVSPSEAGWIGRDAILMTGINGLFYVASSIVP